MTLRISFMELGAAVVVICSQTDDFKLFFNVPYTRI